LSHGKNGFVTATKLGTTNKIFVAAAKNFAAATKRFVVVTKYFVIPILTNDFVGITKPFFFRAYPGEFFFSSILPSELIIPINRLSLYNELE